MSHRRIPRYVLVNHVPLGRGDRPGVYRIGDLWRRDLREQARAVGRFGRLVLAAPVVDELSPLRSGSFEVVDVVPEDDGFDVAPLPHFLSMSGFLRRRGEVLRALRRAVQGADVVHCGSGGHPVSYGELAWDVARRAGARRLFVFDGSDELPRRKRVAEAETNTLKRALRRRLDRRFESFCRRAVGEADLVFAHNAAVVERYADVWSERCHLFERTFVTDDVLASDADLERRAERLRNRARPLQLAAVGRQTAIKATDDVIRAMARARDGGVELRLDVLGEGDELERYGRLAGELGLGHVVTFHASVPYGPVLFDTWSRADLTVVTNVTAEISRNVLLALAQGIPVVGYRNPGHDDLLARAGAGLLVPPRGVEELAAAFAKLDADRERIVEMARRGADFARERTLRACHEARASLVAALFPDAAGIDGGDVGARTGGDVGSRTDDGDGAGGRSGGDAATTPETAPREAGSSCD